MKANLKGANGIELNMDYLKSVGSMFTYFYVPADAMNADVFRAVKPDGAISMVSRSGDEWQIQVRSEQIEWED